MKKIVHTLAWQEDGKWNSYAVLVRELTDTMFLGVSLASNIFIKGITRQF